MLKRVLVGFGTVLYKPLSEDSHTQTFCNEFFEIFGQNRINIAFYEKDLNRKQADCLWPGLLLIEWKIPGKYPRKTLQKIWEQIVSQYIPNLSKDEYPLYYMASNFKGNAGKPRSSLRKRLGW